MQSCNDGENSKFCLLSNSYDSFKYKKFYSSDLVSFEDLSQMFCFCFFFFFLVQTLSQFLNMNLKHKQTPKYTAHPFSFLSFLHSLSLSSWDPLTEILPWISLHWTSFISSLIWHLLFWAIIYLSLSDISFWVVPCQLSVSMLKTELCSTVPVFFYICYAWIL